MTTPSEIANRLLEFVDTVLSDLEEEHAPGLNLPRVHGWHLDDPALLQADTDWSNIAETTYNFIEGMVVDH